LNDGKVTQSSEWEEKAKKRMELMNQYLWNSVQGMYFDYDFVHGRQLDYVSATTFYPMWANAASKEQAASLVKQALPLLEMAGGIAGSTEQSRGPITPEHPLRQWDFPHGWSPHQILIWRGLVNYGYDEIAYRLIYRWLYSITVNAVQYHGTVPEKFDVVTRSHQVFAEYGNVGTKFSYITREGFGWTNASYQLGLSLLPQKYQVQLNQLIPPEWIFHN
jgi:alpha,alpha-trehalase